MTFPEAPSAGGSAPPEGSAVGHPPASRRSVTGPGPATPGPGAGRASSFRGEQGQRRSARRESLGVLLVVLILVVAIVTIATVHPFSSPPYQFPPPGPTILVRLGTPSVSSVPCAAGGTAYAERIPWTNSTQPITTAQITLRLYEVGDGDVIGDPGVVANATPTDPCAGSPPDSESVWYVVLASPTGVNLGTFTVDNGWTSVGSGGPGGVIENASSLILITGNSFAGTGRGLGVFGFVNDTSIRGSTLL